MPTPPVAELGVVRRFCAHPVNHVFRVLLPIVALLCGCEHRPTQADLEREVLRATLRYYYDQDLSAEERAEAKVIFVGTPGEMDDPKGRPLIQTLFHDPSPDWLAALTSTGIPIRPASQAAYVPTEQQPWFHDPKTGQRVVVFCIDSITFPSANHATVGLSSSWAPLAGGAYTYQLVCVAGVWRVSDAHITAVF